ncbi:N-acetylglucosamine kinase [Brevibacillus panacihumi W25]|uniref:N-acetylglucosamine kinase n=1 Tax=Brevibacillus panacihumi W25 TaxID=1408254 RepID=V6M879_9BACL|nr:BadF/BadG/BcrA/BcrD ATPase family protein [Brevibacillus panacihumi]EST54781.1 N-acetylglucosamine kinase [Brevibacillus panacihumi W25]
MQSNKQRKRWVIGIDGGGTKTRAAIADTRGQVAAIMTGDASNPLSRPWTDVEQTLRELIEALLRSVEAGSEDVAALYLGLAGADRALVANQIASAFGQEWQGRLFVDNDATAALYAGTWGEPGIVLIAGTGSIAYAIDRHEQRHRAGGWGYLLGDEGSGFDLGKQAVVAVLRAFDGRGEATSLTEALLAHFAIRSPVDAIALIYGSPNPRKELADCSRLVEQAAQEGDAVAKRIIQHAAASLVELVLACQRQLDEPLPVVLAGGLLSADTSLKRELEKKASFELCPPVVTPVVGALVAGMRKIGLLPDGEVIEQLRKTQAVQEGSDVDE